MLVCSQQSYAKGKQMEQPRKPPQEAIDACDGKQKGDEVWFIGRRGEKLQAHCEIIGNVLAAVPKGHKQFTPIFLCYIYLRYMLFGRRCIRPRRMSVVP